MAITKLMNIKQGRRGGSKHLNNSIRYIMNPKKTNDGELIGGNSGFTPQEVGRKTGISFCYQFSTWRGK